MHKRAMIRSARDILKLKRKNRQQELINTYRENRDNQEDAIGSEIYVTKEAEAETETESYGLDENINYDDILMCHILPRVPAKSIIRFKSISKGYYSFLTTPMFARMHQEHHQNHHKLLFISNTSSLTFRTVDCDKLVDGFTSERHFPFEVDSPQDVSIITSFNGLVCVGIKDKRKDKYRRLILWNPLTGDYKTLSNTNACKDCYEATERVSVLYYISSEDDYELLRVTNSCNVYIYSLKSDSWRKIKPTEEFHRVSCSFSDHNVSLNDKLYVLKRDNKADVYSVISFDLKTEKFTEAETPFFRNHQTSCLGFTVLRGCIHVWMHKHSDTGRYIDLWRMSGDGHGVWMKVVSFWESIAFDDWCMQPLHLMADGKWLMLYKQCLYNTNPVKPNTLVWSYSTMEYRYRDMHMDIPPRGKYLETLASPNHYMK